MNHNVQSLCLFDVLTIVVYSPYLYAPAQPLWAGPTPYTPDPSVFASCEEWLVFEGLTENITDGDDSNLERALVRVKQYDQDKHVWAACYVYFISSFPTSIPQFRTLHRFCQKVNPGNAMMHYVSLKYANMSCADWLIVYGYHHGNINNSENVQMALNRKLQNDNDPHYLVAMYSKYIVDRLRELTRNPPRLGYVINYPTDFLAPAVFCTLYKNDMGEQLIDMPFATLDTIKLCHEWIVLAGYSAFDGYNNALKALLQNDLIKGYHSIWTIEYINYIIILARELERINPLNSSVENLLSESRILTPEEFCNINGFVQLVYYNRVHDN